MSDEQKPVKRIEGKVHSKDKNVRLRLSRTGGLNLGWHPFRGITLNSKHGLRLSKTFKGLTLGFQGGRSLVRGHWSIGGGLINTNLSKSGLSFSTRSKFGTFNWTRPKRSSFKILGIQFRGLKAAIPALFFALITLTFGLISLLFGILKMLPPVLVFLGQLIFFIGALIMRVAELAYHSLMFTIFDLPQQLRAKKTEAGSNADTQ